MKHGDKLLCEVWLCERFCCEVVCVEAENLWCDESKRSGNCRDMYLFYRSQWFNSGEGAENISVNNSCQWLSLSSKRHVAADV